MQDEDFGEGFERQDFLLLGRSYPLVFQKGDAYLSSQGALDTRAQEAENFYKTCHPLIRDLGADSTACIDVGANVGITTIALSQISSSSAPGTSISSIVAIEPGPTSFKCLKSNVHDLPNVTTINCALGSRAGRLGFVNAENNSSASHLILDDNLETGGCLVSRLDHIVDSLSLPHVGFIKIDVEGYERNVLLGAVHTIEKFNPWIYLEFNSWTQIAYGGVNPKDFLYYLLDWFGVIHRVNKSTGALEPILSKQSAIGFLHSNLVYNGCFDDLVMQLRE